jgi:6-phosphofructokinase 1
MKRVAVLTSGGDAPGMNAAIRAVVRGGASRGHAVLGVRHGYTGLIAGDFLALDSRSVGGILDRGGTMLGTTRCEELKTEGGLIKAIKKLREHDIAGLIVIGGNGSQAGAYALSQLDYPVVGVASTIDNDLFGSEPSIGSTTALDIALEAIDRLRTTASAHKRVFLVETMGRNSGYLALMAAIAGGAEAVVLPEIESTPESVAEEILDSYRRGKRHAIIVVAEGARLNAHSLAQQFRSRHQELGFELRVSILGHIQRGGPPNAFDRLLATRLGAAAIEYLANGRYGILLGTQKGDISATPLSEVVSRVKPTDLELIRLARMLAY